MAEQKKPMSAATIAAFLAGAGFGVGTEVIIKPATPEEPGWACSVLADNKVFCKPMGETVNASENLIVSDSPDGGTDGGVP